MPTHTGRLLLTPQAPPLVPNPRRLRMALTESGFLGAPIAGQEDAFLVGDHFLGLITFAGCSVKIELAPPTDGGGSFCHLRFSGPYEHPRPMTGRNTRPPRCRSCRAPLKEWRQQMDSANSADPASIPCPACGDARLISDWDWKKHGGYGRFFVQVVDIFPGEAVPTPGLMRILEESTRIPWRYFYVHQPIHLR